jgi:hypothetical protein
MKSQLKVFKFWTVELNETHLSYRQFCSVLQKGYQDICATFRAELYHKYNSFIIRHE